VVAKAHERPRILTRRLSINNRYCYAIRRLRSIRYRVPDIDLVSGAVHLLKRDLYTIVFYLGRFLRNVFRSRKRLSENQRRNFANLVLGWLSIGVRLGTRIRRGIGADQHVHGGKRTGRIEFVAQLRDAVHTKRLVETPC